MIAIARTATVSGTIVIMSSIGAAASVGPQTQESRVLPTAPDGGDHFGQSVAVSGGVSVVGAYVRDNAGIDQAGGAFVFRRTGAGTWVQETQLTPSDAAAADHFGFSVATDGLYAVVGAPDDNENNVVDQGAVYVFRRGSGGNWGTNSNEIVH